jgi:O-antigen/teichoic acid export membrane protein
LIEFLKKYKQHLKSGLLYISSVSLSTFVNILAGFLVLRWVGPEEMGIWQLLLIINTYALIANLGLNSGLAREFPYLLGKGEKEKSYFLVATVKSYSIFTVIITIICWLVLLVFFYFTGRNTIFLVSFSTIMFMLGINFYKDYVLTLFRTNVGFLKLSKSLLIQSLVCVILLPLIIFYKYYGYLLYNILTSIVSLGLLMLINPVRIKGNFRFSDFKLLFKTGMPLFLMAYLYGVSKTFIKFAVLHFGGILMLGLFAPVFAIRNGISILPKAISQYIYPKFTYKIGETNNPSLLWKPVKNISFILLISFGLLVLPIYYFMPELLSIFFPKYIDSLFACRMALLSGVIYSSFVGITSLNSIKGYRERIIISGLYIGFSAFLPFVLPIFFAQKIVGLAWSMLIIDSLYFITAYCITKKKLLNL